MNRSNKNKIAVTLLSALAFGANAQAQDFNKNKIVKTDSFQVNGTKTMQNSRKLGQVTGIVKEADWGKKALVITVVSLFGLETVHSIIGAATDSPVGSWSIGRAIKNRVKKNNQPGGPNKKNPSKKIDDKKDDKKAEDKVDENTKIIENMSDKFNVINGEERRDSFKKALVEILKLENNDEFLNKYSNVEFQPSNQPEKLKFVDFVKGFIDLFKQGRVTIKKVGDNLFWICNASNDNVIYFHSVVGNNGLIFINYGKHLFKFSKGGQLEILPD